MNTDAHILLNEPLLKKNWGFSDKDHVFRKGILITGANSYIGCHVIELLQDQWEGNIHLLIRSKSKDEAIQRMIYAFKRWKLAPFMSKKFKIHLGDLFENNMGLKDNEHDALNADTGTVLHLAMQPLYHLPYRHFKQNWLPELERMIAFCGNSEYPKRLHYPSSFNANFFTCNEDFNHLNTNAWQSGYAGFKWIANKVIENAFQQNLAGCIYDIPLVVGSLSKGLCPENYSVWQILGLFREAGIYIDFEFKIIPVDILAKLMVSNLLADQNGEGRQFVRPVLEDPINERLISKTMSFILGLKHSDRDALLKGCTHKRKCNFMIPANFQELLEKVNHLNAVWPRSYEIETLPSAKSVFQRNVKTFLLKFHQTNVH